MYAYYILHKLRRFPWEWIDRPYHDKMAVFALIDEKNRRDRLEKAKMELKQKRTPKPRRVAVRKRR